MDEIINLKKRIHLLTEQTENLTERNKELSEELVQMREIYVSSMDYGSALENELQKKIESLTNNFSKQSKEEENDHDRDLRLRLSLEISKNEHLELINKSLMEQIEQLRLLYVNVSSHSTALENDLDEKYEEVKRLSITDPLTGIYNRSGFYKSMDVSIESMARKKLPLSLIMMDIDDFKSCNDEHGHDVGDDVILLIVETAIKSIRKSEIITRWGGEEFLFIIPELDLKKTVLLANRIRKNIEVINFGLCGNLTCSFGVSGYIDGEAVGACIKRADIALYRAKSKGKNRVEGCSYGQK